MHILKNCRSLKDGCDYTYLLIDANSETVDTLDLTVADAITLTEMHGYDVISPIEYFNLREEQR